MKSKKSYLRLLTSATFIAAFAAACEETPDPGDVVRRDATSSMDTFDPNDVPGGDTGIGRCSPGVDQDGDGLDNATECMLGSDPTIADTDMDGIPDGVEARYGRICVADDPMQQRRCMRTPGGDAGRGDGGDAGDAGGDAGYCGPPMCNMDVDCIAGEHCRGLNPAGRDTDMDGVPDQDEDLNRDGIIDVAMGETDPRLADTDGDGRPDNESGVEICRPMGLATVTIVRTPMVPMQVGHDPAFGMARTVPGRMTQGAVLVDDMATQVAGIVAGLPARGDVRAEAANAESLIQTGLGMGTTAVLVGRALTTHEMNPAVQSTYRVARATSATALRDALVMPLTGSAAPAGPAFGDSMEFIVEVTTVLRTMTMTTDVIVAIAPRSMVDNTMMATSIRMNDLTNATGVSEGGKTLGFACQVIRAEQGTTPVDFLWTVDTSGSMGPYQEAVGRTASRFVERMTAAGVDFRVGVMQANVGLPNLDVGSDPARWPGGFHWINGTDPMAGTKLCEHSTSVSLGRCPTSPTDMISPYQWVGGANSEEPIAMGVQAHYALSQRSARGEMNIEHRFRDGAKVAVFAVTDEPGSNDFTRFFARSPDPQTMLPFGPTYNMATLNNIIGYYRRNEILTFGLVPRLLNEQPMDARPIVPCDRYDVNYLPRCVIEGNGGAYIPIRTISAATPAAVRMAFEADIDAAMGRIVDLIAGAASQFQLDRSPITSTLKVRVRGMDVPRSRAEGFDYDPASRSIIFFGRRFRPMRGDEVVISYRVWDGSLG